MSYDIADVVKAIQNPMLMRGEIRKYGERFNRYYHNKLYPEGGFDIFEEDWDNLLILDGCRYDTFVGMNDLPGKLEHRISQGSTSWEFMQGNFQGRELYDTVYITANPHLYRLDDGIFHAVVDLLEYWNDELQTVSPSQVVAAAEDVVSAYPEKRYIFHFMQPHYPFLGETGEELDHRGHQRNVDSPELEQPSIWEVLQWGKSDSMTEQKVWKAYKENLRLVLDEVKKLLEIVDGRTIITADHGNLIGDRMKPIIVRGYGHPPGLRSPELIKVPWHIIVSDTQRDITSESPPVIHSRNESDVDDQLTALGYKS